MSDCIIAIQERTPNGYVRIQVMGKKHQAHRYAWEIVYGAIPQGMVVDHICHNESASLGLCDGGPTCDHRACINLDHLRLVTQQENIRAGLWSVDTKAACKHGHPYPENIMVRANGKRECAECNRIRSRRAAV